MTQLFTNNANSALASDITKTATSLAVAPGTGTLFPAPAGGDYFLLTLIGPLTGAETAWEIVKVTARATDELTIVRAQESTEAAAWGNGTKVELRATAGTLAGKQPAGSYPTGSGTVSGTNTGDQTAGGVENTPAGNIVATTVQAALNELDTKKTAMQTALEEIRAMFSELLIPSLFANSQQGAWYDSSDITTLYQDSAGTTRVTAGGQPVGKINDKSGRANNANQATSTARPKLISERMNVLSSTEHFNNAVWAKSAISVLANNSAAPDGTFTADKIVGNVNGTAANSHLTQNASFTTGPGVVSFYAKAAGYNFVRINTGFFAAGRFANFNLTNGSVTQAPTAANTTAGSISVGNGWYRLWLATDTISSTPATTSCSPMNGGTGSGAGQDGVNGVLVWGGQVEYGATVGAYQRVNTATDYDTAGFTTKLALDKIDDALTLTIPTGGFVGTMVLSTTEGTAAYGVNIPAGSHSIGGVYHPGSNIVGDLFRDGALTDAEIANVSAYMVSKGGGPSGSSAYSGVTSLQNYWRGMNRLTSFPLLDTAAVTNMERSWQGCSSLTTFPLLDTSAVTNINVTWYGCSSMTVFPSNMFDACPATNFVDAFVNCALTQTSVDNILVSINVANTSNGTLSMTGGTSATPSATGITAKNALVARGWTVTTN